MSGKRWCGWLPVGLAAVLLVAGCSMDMLKGYLMEKQFEDGHEERIKVDGGESWTTYHPNATRGDGATVMLRKETTF